MSSVAAAGPGRPYQRVPLGDPDLTLYLLEGAAVLHHRRCASLYGLDAAATAALLRADLGLAPLSGGLAAVLDGTPEAERYVSDWERLPPAPTVEAGPGYRLMGMDFLLRADAPAAAGLHAALAYLERSVDGPWPLVVEVRPRDGAWQLLFNGIALTGPVCTARLYPTLHDRIRVLAYQRCAYLLALHAAVVERDGRALLLPGASGAGKSTLTALLLAHGFRLLSDETAVLTEDTLHALPVPMPIGLKRGSWDRVARYFPVLCESTEHERWDGQAVRYLHVPQAYWCTAPTGVPPRAVVFPRYRPGAALAVRRLGPLETLRRLTSGGYQFRGELSGPRVERLLDWLLAVPAFALDYGSSGQALAGVEECLAR